MPFLTIPTNYRMNLLRWRVLPPVPAGARSTSMGSPVANCRPSRRSAPSLSTRIPFSAQYDTPGYGRVEILTKPGTDKLHGQLFMNASASVFNTSNPFALNQPPYHTLQFDGNVSGALGKKASFFINFDRRRHPGQQHRQRQRAVRPRSCDLRPGKQRYRGQPRARYAAWPFLTRRPAPTSVHASTTN